jgi:hydroxyacylglutathione hydrolase
VLTGDTLFIGDVGRPDLRASLGWSATDLGRLLHESLRTKLLPLPDETLVYPAHGAGSLCGKSLSTETVSTIGDQRRSNYALQPMAEDDFVNLVLADQPDAPAYFTYDAVLNSKEHPTLDAILERELRPLPLERVLEMQAAGAQILDVRDPADFANGHLAGSINIGLSGQYATWAGTVLDREQPVVTIGPPGAEAEAAMRLGRIGLDRVAGYLEGGMHALEHRPDLIVETERIGPTELAGELGSSAPPFLLDVRAPREWKTGHIAGGMNLPLNHLEERLPEVPRGRRVVVHCAGGYRSSIAASLLQRRGHGQVAELTGGLAAWEAAKLPIEHGIVNG